MDSQRFIRAADADHTRLGFRCLKRGASDTALVMVHGLASNLTRWTEFVSHFHNGNDWDLVRIDLRGHGTSPFRGKISHDIWVDDLHTLLQHEGYKHAVIVGHSLGAQVALHFAHRFPQLTAGLVLIDPIFPDCLQGNLATVARYRPMLRLLIHMAWLLNGLGFRKKHFPELDLFRLDQETRDLLRSNRDVNIGQIYARPLSDIKNLPLANYLQDLYEVTRPLPPLATIAAPVLVLLSKGVSLSRFEQTQQRISQMANAETVFIEADHWMLTEKPDEAREAIERWCDHIC